MAEHADQRDQSKSASANESSSGGRVRWGYLVPRLVILALALLLLEWGGGWLIGRFLLRLADHIPGISVAAAHVHAGFLSGRCSADDLRFAVVEQLKERGVVAEHVEVQFDRRQLSHKKFVIEHAKLDGVRFESHRAADADDPLDGHFLAQARRMAAAAQGQAIRVLQAWETTWGKKAEAALVESSETAREARRIERAWRARTDRWRESAVRWEQQLAAIERAWRESSDLSTPEQVLRLAPLVPRIEQLLKEWKAAEREIEQLDQVWQSDRRALEQARQRDLQRLQSVVRLKSFDMEPVARAVVGRETLDKLDQAQRWLARIQQVRRWITYRPPANRLEGRGRFYSFDRSGIPTFWIRQLTLRGSFDQDDRPVPVHAVLLDVASQPELLDRPVRCVVRAEGPAACRLEWIDDSRSPAATAQRLTIDFDPWELAGTCQSIGDKITWRLTGGTAHAWFWSVRRRGRSTSRLRLQLTGLRSTMECPGLPVLAEASGFEFSPQEPVSIELEWEGNRIPDDLAWHSNLGQLLQKPLESALAEAVARYRDEAVQKLMQQQTMVESRIEKATSAQRGQLARWSAALEPIYRRLKLDPTAALRSWSLRR